MSAAADLEAVAGLRRRSSRRRRQRALLLVAGAIAFAVSVAFYLGATGTSALTISAAPGNTNGNVANVITSGLSGGTTKGNTTSGLPIAKVVIAKDYVDNADGRNVRITVAWTNASNGALNGKDVIGVGLYYPVSTTSSSSCGSYVVITDGSTNVCLAQDTAVTGKHVDTGSGDTYHGLIPMVASLQTGFFMPGTSPGSAPSNCATDGTGSSWCLLSGESTASTRTMYVVANVLNPAGHAPPGQQPSPGDLSFFVRAKAVG